MFKKNYLAFIPVAVGVLLSLLAIWFYGVDKHTFGDAPDYIDAARALLNGTPYPRMGEFHPIFRAPVFPGFIALVWTFFPDSIVAFKVAQALLHGAICFVVYKLAFELVQKHFPAFLAAGICAVNPLFFGHTVDFYSEPLQIFLVVSAYLVLVRMFKNDGHLFYKAALLGFTFALAVLCRPTILPILAVITPAIFLLFIKNQKQRVNYFFASLIVGFSMLATVAPWTYKNYRDLGEFIPVVNGFGYNFWLGNHPDTLRLYEGEYASKEESQAFADHWAGELPDAKMKELEQTDNLSSLPRSEQEKVWRREAFKNIEANPGVTARLFWGKIKAYWTPMLNKFSYPFVLVTFVAMLVIGLYILSPYGAYVLWQDETGRKFVILLVIQFILATLLHAMIIANVRYRTPYVDPFLAILTGIALWQIALRFLPKYKFLNE